VHFGCFDVAFGVDDESAAQCQTFFFNVDAKSTCQLVCGVANQGELGFAHKVWHETSPAVSKAKFPLIGDPTHQLTRAFGVHIEEEGLALRGTFVINPEGMIKTAEVHSNEIARDVKETLRKLKAAQYTAANPGQVCPAKWNEGAKTLTPSLDLVGKI